MTSAPLQSMVWLVATQFLLYAGGWLLCGAMLPRQRAIVLHWAAFMVLTGLGFYLAGQRGDPRTWLAYNGSSLCFLASYLVLHRGLERFLARAPSDGVHALLLAVVVTMFVVIGPSAAQAPLRVMLTYGGGTLLVLRLVVALTAPLRDEFGPRVGPLLALPAYVLMVSLGLRALQQMAQPGVPMEMHYASGENVSQLFTYLIGAALFNFSFIALLTLRTVHRLEHLSTHDPLTGLMNRRALEEALSREWQRFRRRGTPFTVLALDLDHFKRVNDQHGHEAGDDVLVHTAEQMRLSTRATDIVARPGGEEFVILMPDTDAAGAAVVAERLLQRLRERGCRTGKVELRVTASAGCSAATTDDADAPAVLRRADEALYRAKAEGRDRMVVAG